MASTSRARTSEARDARSAKRQKASKPVQEEVEQDDPVHEALQAAFLLLENDTRLTAAARKMLTDAAPSCLQKSKVERHRFQEMVVAELHQLLQGAISQSEQGVAAAEADAADWSVNQNKTEEAIAGAAGKAAELRDAKKDAEQEVKSLAATASAARSALKSAQLGIENIEVEKTELLEQKEEHQHLITDTWGKLKEFSMSGKQWRDRNKMIDAIVSILEAMDGEPSLVHSLPVALKTKPEERGDFANDAIKFGDEYLQKSMVFVNEKVESWQTIVEGRAKDVTEAEEALAAAKAAHDAKIAELEELIRRTSENHHTTRAAVEQRRDLDNRMDRINAAVSEAKADLERCSGVVLSFEALLENGTGTSVRARAASAAGAASASAGEDESAVAEVRS